MSNSIVRDAFVQSVTARPVSFSDSQASIVPKRTLPRSAARSRRPGTYRSSHSIFVPEK